MANKLTYGEVKTLVDANNKSRVSSQLLISLIWKESGFDEKVDNPDSSALGLMQITKAAVADVNKNSPAGVHFEYSEMDQAAKNIDCGSRYLNLRIKWAGDDIRKGLEGFGTGPGYADNLLQCEKCLKKNPADPMSCLKVIHPIYIFDTSYKDITGYWQTQSGAVYHFFREGEYVVATFHKPSSYQLSCGIRSGDLAYKGTLIGNVLAGTFQQRYPLGDKDRCPGTWPASSTLYLQISDAYDSMTGVVLLEHLPDSGCQPDDRRLDTLVFTPSKPEVKVVETTSDTTAADRKLFTSGG